jgi:hypothetical protein
MFFIQNLTWKDWNWYLKLLYTSSEDRKEVGESWLDIIELRQEHFELENEFLSTQVD